MRSANDQSLGEVINDLLKAYRLKDGVMSVRVRECWDRIMEPAIIQRTTGVKLSGKMLIIWVNSSVLRQELQFKKEEIKEAINTELKEKVVEVVEVR